MCSERTNTMNTENTARLIEATIAAVAIVALVGLAAPMTGVAAAGALVLGGLGAVATLEFKKRSY